MSLNLNSIDYLVFALKLFVLSTLVQACFFVTLIIVLLFLREGRILKFKVTSVKLKVDQLIDELTNHFSIARSESF